MKLLYGLEIHHVRQKNTDLAYLVNKNVAEINKKALLSQR